MDGVAKTAARGRVTRSIPIRIRLGVVKTKQLMLGLSTWVLICLSALMLVPTIQVMGAASHQPSHAGTPSPALVGPYAVYVPLALKSASTSGPETCPSSSTAQYNTIPVLWPPADHPDSLHADFNLSLRGYVPTTASLELVDYGGPTDPGAVQLAGLFSDNRVPTFKAAYQVYDWNWGCGPHGCRGSLLTYPDVTLIGMGTSPGEAIHIPTIVTEIYGGGYRAMVLYAEEKRITLGYTRLDSVSLGYSIHIENLCVDPNLLARYRASNAAGRGTLPALRNGETIGIAPGPQIEVAVRDAGTFMDPRSRKDWWQGK